MKTATLPETSNEDFYLSSMLDWTNPEMADYKRTERWRPDRNNNPQSPYSANPADEETDYEYDRENRLTKAILPSGIEVEFEYDGIGRRLKMVRRLYCYI